MLLSTAMQSKPAQMLSWTLTARERTQPRNRRLLPAKKVVLAYTLP